MCTSYLHVLLLNMTLVDHILLLAPYTRLSLHPTDNTRVFHCTRPTIHAFFGTSDRTYTRLSLSLYGVLLRGNCCSDLKYTPHYDIYIGSLYIIAKHTDQSEQSDY